MENLTPKEEKFLEGLSEGKSKLQAIKEAGFNFSNDHSAEVYANKVMSKPKVIERLKIIREKVDNKLAANEVKFIDLLLKYVSMEEIAQILARNLKSKELRVSDSALEKVMRVISAYPLEKQNLLEGANFQLVFNKGVEETKQLTGKTTPLIEEND